jgi:hypothetical protein
MLKAGSEPSAEILDAAAAAHALAGDYAAAVKLIDAAIRQARRTNRKLEEALILRRELYIEEKPYREQPAAKSNDS